MTQCCQLSNSRGALCEQLQNSYSPHPFPLDMHGCSSPKEPQYGKTTEEQNCLPTQVTDPVYHLHTPNMQHINSIFSC